MAAASSVGVKRIPVGLADVGQRGLRTGSGGVSGGEHHAPMGGGKDCFRAALVHVRSLMSARSKASVDDGRENCEG